jgi:hypothetical protein
MTSSFAFVCGLDEGDDCFTDESCWIKANPNLGISVSQDYLRKQVREAKGILGKASLVRRLNFCEWTIAAIRGSMARPGARAKWSPASILPGAS